MRVLRRPTVLGVIVAVAVVALGALAWRAASSSTPVSVEDALETYREHPGEVDATHGPDAGVYTYSASGREVGEVGPMKITRPVPEDVHLVASSTDNGFELQWQVSEQHIEAHRYVLEGGWARLVWRRVNVKFLGLGRDDRRDVTRQSRWIPINPKVGQKWRLDYTTGTLRTTGTGEVLRQEKLEVAGQSVTTYLLSITTETKGAHGGTHSEQLWWSPQLRLPVRLRSRTSLTGVVGFRSTLNVDLKTLQPIE